MPLFSIPGIRFSAVCAAVPANRVSNHDFDLLSEAERAEFIRTVGIETRRIAPPELCASDLCLAAARRVIELTGTEPQDIGALAFVTQTPDYPLPGNSMLIQQLLNLPTSAYLLDLNQGCAGYVYGLATLASVMNAAGVDTGLLLVGDTLSRLLRHSDTSTIPIFSDAGSATLLRRDPAAPAMHFNLGSDGSGADVIRVASGGSRQPLASDTDPAAPAFLSMRGMDVLQYSLKYVEDNVRDLLAFAGGDTETPDYYVLHQANRILNRSLLRRLAVAEEKAPESLFDYGNTSLATIPVTICYRLREALADAPKALLMAGFGTGFSWGSVLVSAEAILCPEPIELAERDGT